MGVDVMFEARQFQPGRFYTLHVPMNVMFPNETTETTATLVYPVTVKVLGRYENDDHAQDYLEVLWLNKHKFKLPTSKIVNASRET
jgi:hypothetical protein